MQYLLYEKIVWPSYKCLQNFFLPLPTKSLQTTINTYESLDFRLYEMINTH